MALDPTAREANIRDSLKKFFVDNLETIEGLQLTFDKSLAVPNLQGLSVNRWVAIDFGDMQMDTKSRQELRIMPCTRQDNEGFRLAQLRDTVMGYLTDIDATDGFQRVTIYRSYPSSPWEELGGGIFVLGRESQQLASDETKFKIIPVTFRWAAKI